MPKIGRRADYRQFHSIATRWTDNDSYGHLNNSRHYQFFDTSICAMQIEAGLLEPFRSETICLVVESGCRYFAPITFPQVVTAGLRVAHLGRSSVRYEIGLFAGDADEAAAEGFFVHVAVDSITRKTRPLPDEWRDFLERLVAR